MRVYLIFSNEYKNFEVLGSWNDWIEPISLKDPHFIINDKFFFIIDVPYGWDKVYYKVRDKDFTTLDNRFQEGCYSDNVILITKQHNYICQEDGENKIEVLHDCHMNYYQQKNKIFEGFIVNGYPNGKGVLLEGDNVYKGNFRNGYKHGYGEFYNKRNELTYLGEFRNNEFFGLGKLLQRDQLLYEGKFKNGEKIDFFIGQVYEITNES